MTATVVLVHGAWHGAWCWDAVVARLVAAGVPVVAPDLPGHGADAGPPGDLPEHVEHLESVLDRVAAPVVLVGHSYGGVVITDAGCHPSVVELVYIAGFMADETESVTVAAHAEAEAEGVDVTGVAAHLRRVDDLVVVDPERATSLFFGDCDPDVADAAAAKLGPQRTRSLLQSPARVAWREKASTYVVCADDRALHPGLQRILARRATRSVEWPTSHSPFLSRPDLVADLLVARATAAAASPQG